MSGPVIIVGSGGHAAVVIDALLLGGFEVADGATVAAATVVQDKVRQRELLS